MLSLLQSISLSLTLYAHCLALHSFPTRRSSDLFCFLALMVTVYVVLDGFDLGGGALHLLLDRKSTRLNSSHVSRSYAASCLKKKRRRNSPRIPSSSAPALRS